MAVKGRTGYDYRQPADTWMSAPSAILACMSRRSPLLAGGWGISFGHATSYLSIVDFARKPDAVVGAVVAKSAEVEHHPANLRRGFGKKNSEALTGLPLRVQREFMWIARV